MGLEAELMDESGDGESSFCGGHFVAVVADDDGGDVEMTEVGES